MNKKNEKCKFAKNTYEDWYKSALVTDYSGYHIIPNGILNKQDYSIIFDGADGRCLIPPEAVNQINFYSNVEISPKVRNILAESNIQINFYDKYGRLISSSIPASNTAGAYTVINQCRVISDNKLRLYLAKNMEEASVHNLRSNIRQYAKSHPDLYEAENMLSNAVGEIKRASDITQLMLIEARARQTYYSSFTKILKNSDFRFTVRSKHPPKDPVNALISFGNTMLYSEFQKIIQMTELDIRLGIIHSSDRRYMNLNLDFADIYKPVITDRIIFSMINRGQLPSADESFVQNTGSVYLSDAGKRAFVREYIKKINTSVQVNGHNISYKNIMTADVRALLSFINGAASNYRPYKYY